ncbi:hypothetical protein OG946_10205 [Streptomyces sp. NBC_01808]|uniref:hypothetical protein n=1 Tax=Streptomyces sp. NBC_01808 TaxID=2975947 RepID=UPI002DD90F68|nr:hypothetical protein [Streptomyces sp. NBC_01808]WSA37729.1 hypothetical protein OG946_10205 [Streptomyces sp. NBC_01808]
MAEQAGRIDYGKRPGRPEPTERAEGPARTERAEGAERTEQPQRPERTETPERAARTDRTDKSVVDRDEGAAVGYTLVLPPNWSRIPLRDGTDEAIMRIVDEAVADLPDDMPRDRIPPVRLELVRRLRKAAADARKSGGLDLYLPVEQMHGVTVAASFVVSEITLATGADPSLILARLLADAEKSQPAAVDGSVGYRNERVARGSGDEGGEYASRRVDYVLAVPEDDTRWVTVGFSTLADGDPKGQFADVLVELFDALMTTFRWTRSSR